MQICDSDCSVTGRKSCEVERGVQKLDLTGKRRVQLRAGSEMNLITAGKTAKCTSFRQSLAFCTERAQVTQLYAATHNPVMPSRGLIHENIQGTYS